MQRKNSTDTFLGRASKKCKSHPSSFSSSSLPPLFCLQFPAAHATKLQEERGTEEEDKKTFSNILYNIKNIMLHSIEVLMTSSDAYGGGEWLIFHFVGDLDLFFSAPLSALSAEAAYEMTSGKTRKGSFH